MLKIEGVSKVFPGVKALAVINREVAKADIHSLIGENGAGKSTLIKILAGIYQPDGGKISVDGKEVKIGNVADSKALGISIIHQELSLAPNMTVAENIFLGKFPGRALVDEREMYQATEKLLGLIGMEKIRPDKRVSGLSVAQQQMVEICRALSENIKILIMDEPTASLATAEVERLLDIMRMLKKKGVTILI